MKHKTQQLNIHTHPKHYGLLEPHAFILWEKLGIAVALPNLRDQMQYRRAKIPGGTYFFTVVTYQRSKILCEPDNIALLREIFRFVITNHPITIDDSVEVW